MVVFICKSISLFFESFSCLLAALILAGQKPEEVWKKTLGFALISTVMVHCAYCIPVEAVRHPVNWIICIIVYKIVFRHDWLTSVKNYALLFIVSILPGVGGWFGLQWFLEPEDINPQLSERFWLASALIMPFLFSSTIPIAVYIRKLIVKRYWFFAALKAQRKYTGVFLAVVGQIALLFLLLDSSTDSLFNRTVQMVFWLAVIGIDIFLLYFLIRSRESSLMMSAEKFLSSNINNLINTIRTQRHDFNNHLQVLVGLCQNHQLAEMEEYISRLSSEVYFFNEIIKLDNPFIAALINAKMAFAESCKVRMETNIGVSLRKINTNILDIVRILGNLLDNAIEAVDKQQREGRWVKFAAFEKGPLLVFEISNPGTIPKDIAGSLLKPGVSSKKDGHEGLGLYSAIVLAEKLGGVLHFCENDSVVTFSVMLPK